MEKKPAAFVGCGCSQLASFRLGDDVEDRPTDCPVPGGHITS